VIIADTQIVIWATLDPSRLSKKAVAALKEARSSGAGMGIASSTLWELAMAVTRGRIRPNATLGSYLGFIEKNFVVHPITAQIAERSVQFTERYPKDPMDRLIGATALALGFPLITADVPIRKSGEVPCIW
jgi:PIN domain nuclease of toxin-antitoxin system